MDDVGTFHRFARAYDLLMPDADGEILARGLAAADREVETVVDLAGGTGRGLRAIGRVGDDRSDAARSGTVLDAAAGMVGRARGHGHSAVRGDAGRLPLRDESVDAVVIVDALHHLPHQAAVLEEVARVLAPGGVLVVQEFDPTTVRGRVLAAAERLAGFDASFDEPDVLQRRLQRAGLQSAVIDGGFSYVVAGVRGTTGGRRDGDDRVGPRNGRAKSPGR